MYKNLVPVFSDKNELAAAQSYLEQAAQTNLVCNRYTLCVCVCEGEGGLNVAKLE